MTEPSRKILALRRKLYNFKDKRLIDDELREIQNDVVALEIQVSKLGAENVRLVHEANVGVPEVEVPF